MCWLAVKKLALRTVGKTVVKLPDTRWKYRILLAEHSPIRALLFTVVLENIPTFVSTHLVRHKHGVEHFVRSQRSDYTQVDRSTRKQTDLISHTMVLNAQALISISRKRLCMKADASTRKVWQTAMEDIKQQDSVVAAVCVRECVYRGFCPEARSCGYVKTKAYTLERQTYISL